MLQPESLEPNESFGPANSTLKAARELDLLDGTDSDSITLSEACKKNGNTPAAILSAFDQKVLSEKEIEPYFALFYAYRLGLGKEEYKRKSFGAPQWADAFNQAVFGDERQPNPFNSVKAKGWADWVSYAGLGWYDLQGSFQANPYERVMRALPRVFRRSKKLGADDFMKNLAEACPELDGGHLFIQANPKWNPEWKRCSLGLSHALIELHLDNLIKLDCPADSAGWSLEEAEPPRDQSIVGDRITAVEYSKK